MWEKRSKIIFISIVSIAGMVFLEMTLYALSVMFGWELTFNLIQICKTEIQLFGFSPLGYVLDALVFYSLLLMIWMVAKQIVLSNNMYKKLTSYGSEKVPYETQQNPGHYQPITVIDHPSPIALTIGLFCTEVIISTGLVELLDENELDAVIHHELFHQQNRDPLKTFLLSLFVSVIWYMPILSWLLQKYKMIREILADDYAIKKLGTPLALGGALLKLLKRRDPAPMPYSFVSFADTSINYRIKQIVDPRANINLKLPLVPTLVSLYVLLLLCTMFTLALS